jgi:hypothetical protein
VAPDADQFGGQSYGEGDEESSDGTMVGFLDGVEPGLGSTPWWAYIRGIDLSRWQEGPNNFRALRAGGFEFAVAALGRGHLP